MLPLQDILTVLNKRIRTSADVWDLDKFAQKAGWSRFHFHRSFKAAIGETPKQFEMRVRLESAATLLQTTDKQVIEIAIETGFSSHEVFARAFRRHFKSNPSDFRTRFSIDDPPSAHSSAEVVRSLGPCVGLFHLSSKQKVTSHMPTSSVEIQELAPQPIVFIQRQVPQTQLQPLFAECFPKLFGHCMQNGLEMVGQPIARYVEIGVGNWTVDCAIPIKEQTEDQAEIQSGVLQSGPTAIATHFGEYENLPESYAVIENWMTENNWKNSGPIWESYETSPAEHPNPADWQTKIYWPITRP